ncbi:MAG: tetrahydromethanopterin S-methyltransferase subunit H, partial [Candidatus Hydrothermarchaeota archaeon]
MLKLFKIDREQEVINIGDTKIGGQIGENPTVLVGTIFYEGHKIVENQEKGIFDENKADELINEMLGLSDITGNPCMIQVFALSNSAIERYLDFVSRFDRPILVDSTEYKVRLHGIKYSEEIGLVDKVIYNSLSVSMNEEEINTLKESDIESSILLAFNPMDSSVRGKINLLENGAGILKEGLLNVGRECFSKILIDTAVTPFGEGASHAMRCVLVSKSRFGLPTGNGIHNAVSAWKWIRERRKKDVMAYRAC